MVQKERPSEQGGATKGQPSDQNPPAVKSEQTARPKPSGDSPKPHGDPLAHTIKD